MCHVRKRVRVEAKLEAWRAGCRTFARVTSYGHTANTASVDSALVPSDVRRVGKPVRLLASGTKRVRARPFHLR